MSIEEFTGNIYLSDSSDFLKSLPSNSVDLIPTDTPYGIGICESDWDQIPPLEVFREMNRVLKPGKWLYCMSSPRQDTMMEMLYRIKKAGFDIGFTSLYWCYLNGHFYASKVRKFVVKKAVIPDYIYEGFLGFNPTPAVEVILIAMKKLSEKNYLSQALSNRGGISRFERCKIPVEEQLRARECGTQPHPMDWDKPHEQIWEGDPNGRYPANILCSDGALDFGNVTVSTGGDQRKRWDRDIFSLSDSKTKVPHGYGDKGDYSRYFSLDAWWEKFCDIRLYNFKMTEGRYPANILVSDNALDQGAHGHSAGSKRNKMVEGEGDMFSGYLSEGAGVSKRQMNRFGDSGGYSRFFDLDAWWRYLCQFLFIKKPSVKEKDAGLDDLPDKLICTKTGESRPSRINREGDFGGGHKRMGKNPHISVKPIKLMSYLIEMGSDPNDIVVDPYCGSGTTGISSLLTGRRFIGNDIDPYMIDEVVPRRLMYWNKEIIRRKEEKKTGLGAWI